MAEAAGRSAGRRRPAGEQGLPPAGTEGRTEGGRPGWARGCGDPALPGGCGRCAERERGGPGGGLVRNRCGGAPRPPGSAGASLPSPGTSWGRAGHRRAELHRGARAVPAAAARALSQGQRRGRAVAPGAPLLVLKPSLPGLGVLWGARTAAGPRRGAEPPGVRRGRALEGAAAGLRAWLGVEVAPSSRSEGGWIPQHAASGDGASPARAQGRARVKVPGGCAPALPSGARCGASGFGCASNACERRAAASPYFLLGKRGDVLASPLRRDVHCESVLTRFYFGPKGEEGVGRRFWLTQADRPLYHCCRRGCCLLCCLLDCEV